MADERISENELRLYWQCALDARRPPEPLTVSNVADLRDELEILGEMTDWPRLRDACRSTAASLVEPAGRLVAAR